MRRNPDKAELYAKIEEHKNRWKISSSDYPINTLELCDSLKGITLGEFAFITPGLRGIATKRESINGSDIILLNSLRTDIEKNFDCGHEMIHLVEHRDVKAQSFHCFDKVLPQQDIFIEWQANEGAAEFLVPYKKLLPIIRENLDQLEDFDSIWRFKSYLADTFMVTETVIKIRFENLKYEIFQHLNGCPIDELDILSRDKQKMRGIKVRSINDIENADYVNSMLPDEYVTEDERELLDKLKFGE